MEKQEEKDGKWSSGCCMTVWTLGHPACSDFWQKLAWQLHDQQGLPGPSGGPCSMQEADVGGRGGHPSDWVEATGPLLMPTLGMFCAGHVQGCVNLLSL